MAGRTAFLGDQREHQIRVEVGGVGGREVAGYKDARPLEFGDAGRCHSGQLGDDPVPDVLHVPGAFGQVISGFPQRVREAVGGLVHRARRGQ